MRRPAKIGDHYDYTDSDRRVILGRIRTALREWDQSLIETVTAGQRIAYNKPGKTIFLEVKVQRQAIVLHMVDVPDPHGLLIEIPESHGWRQLSRRARIESLQELEQVLPLVRIALMHG